jgi:uncharacterized protein (TIGR02594 family)
MNLPKKYAWLALEGAPRHLVKALELYGVEETVGPKHNPVIMGWARELGITYRNDETPWCGLFVGICIKRADRQPVEWLLGARNWVNFGVKSSSPMLGDILVFSRPGGGGHVGFYVGEDTKNFFVLGGNQGNAVSIVKIVKSRLLEARRPAYHTPPTNIRKIVLNIEGKPSENEA